MNDEHRCCLCGRPLVEPGICDSCNDIRKGYRNIRPEIMTDLLTRLNIFTEDIKTDEERILRNFGWHLLYLMGIISPANAGRIVDGLLNIPAREKVARELKDE